MVLTGARPASRCRTRYLPRRNLPNTLAAHSLIGLAGSGLAGVAQSELDIDEGLRTAAVVTRRLEAAGLRVATAGEYADWVAGARERSRAAAQAMTARPTPA